MLLACRRTPSAGLKGILMTSPLQILLIDDDELDRAAVERALRQGPLDCHTTHAATAVEGLKLAAELHFDAIFLDYRLPDKDGIDVLRLLRGGEFKSVAIIMLSRMEDDALAESCLDAGAQDFLLKDEVNSRRLTRAMLHARQRYQNEKWLIASREHSQQLSERDVLTGLTNRRGFEQALSAGIARAQRGDDRLAVLLLDLDDFKSVNDTLGHDAGDTLLIEVTKRLSATVRDSDLLCRLGGDEFVILMSNVAREEHLALLADRLIVELQVPIAIGNKYRIVTASIGIATWNAATDTAVDLLRFADMAMYQAKQNGRNQSQFFSVALQEAAQTRARIKNSLQSAFVNKEFEVHYQAQINPVDGSVGGMEALLRWRHPQLGLLSPASFMDVAEEIGLVVDIGNWVLQTACKQLGEWQLRHPVYCQELTLGINLSVIQVAHKTLPDTVKTALEHFSLTGNHLELGITESALIKDTSATITTFTKITDYGVTLSLDDFGTGYSSLEHLKLFPISVLKIDRGFVCEIGRNKKSEQLLVAIIAFAKSLGMKAVAEGIETKEQAEFCSQYGCDLLQGYYFSFPVPAVQFEADFFP